MKAHPFERAGYGKAPYRVALVESVKVEQKKARKVKTDNA